MRRIMHGAYRDRHLPVANAASRRGVRAALAALADSAPGPAGDVAWALREQLHQEARALDERQGVLILRSQP